MKTLVGSIFGIVIIPFFILGFLWRFFVTVGWGMGTEVAELFGIWLFGDKK